MQQISGRAGRFGTQNDQGFVSSVHDTDLRFLNYTLNMETPQVNKAGLQPRWYFVKLVKIKLDDLDLNNWYYLRQCIQKRDYLKF